MNILKFHFKKTIKTVNFIVLLVITLLITIYMGFNNGNINSTTICYENNSSKEFNLEYYNVENIKFVKKNEECNNSIYISEIYENKIIISEKGNINENSVKSVIQEINIRQNLKTEYKPLEIVYERDNNDDSIYNRLSFIIYFIILMLGSQIFQAITSERINKINTMIEFKFSSIKLIWIKIIANILSFTVIISVFALGQILLNYIGKETLFNFNNINIDIKNFYIVILFISYLLLYLLTFSYIGSFVKSEDQVQGYGFLPVIIALSAFGISIVFDNISNVQIKTIIEVFPFTSLFVLPKITSDPNLIIKICISFILTLIFMIIISKKIRKNFRKEA